MSDTSDTGDLKIITVDVRFFGAFRKYGEETCVILPAGYTVGELKKQLRTDFSEPESGLLADSVMAGGNRFLSDDEVLTEDVELALLPPVCGG